MKLFKDCWVALLELFNALTLTPTDGQQSLGLERGHGRPHNPHYPHQPSNPTVVPKATSTPVREPVFSPPSHGQFGDSSIVCDYRRMGAGWGSCSTADDRGCWLKGPNGQKFDINTDYETKFPTGVTRKYHLDVVKMAINADGVVNPWGKVFNHKYPGPWIQACWGDDIEITVKNHLQFNGTTIHWHGIRMLNTFEMDGVNAVTQCPIATGDHFTYKFKALQYGTSWYHSHYSLQYGDGMLGPLTIHGPATASYDRPIDPVLMTDWNHRSAFQDFQKELTGPVPPKMDSILLNGIGSYAAVGKGGFKYNITMEYGKKYLLRLINTSVDTTFVFAIDGHWLKVIASDFVPIRPYTVDHVVIGIGQRYHVIVEAKPHDDNNQTVKDPGAYWIRTIAAEGCSSFLRGGVPDERQGVLYYRKGSTEIPTGERGDFSIACRDEPYDKLVPYLPWTVARIGGHDEVRDYQPFEVGLETPEFPNGRPKPNDLFARWSIGAAPMWLNFSDPTVLNLDKKNWPVEKVVIPKNYPADSWVYLIITSAEPDEKERLDKDRLFVPAAHPIHLHGHDFALLQQSNETYSLSKLKPKYDNPPRRDVVLLPVNGFIVIGFKADNPGAWALHCHIAWHASSGLALQVLERQDDALALLKANPHRLKEVHRTCHNWKKWFANPHNFWHPEGGVVSFQDDSGI